jgi:two-component system sensor histidine kinase KdpD
MSNQRPNPDQLLAEVQKHEVKQQCGRLKVFFGMSAGVGKTFAMIEEARARAAEGLNVLVGYAEQHIRPETEALLLGMDILPYKIVEYRGAKLKELDLDAALAKRPSLILVDELAHTNAPGMRHPKRWQDVMELLDAGINVYTTLNVQHLESVNDIVERITGVKVRETLPDSVLERADEVELVDIAPEELLERFREGKIYRPEQAERASRHFFTIGNLLALRELALRTTAQRVDAQMQDARRESGTRATWPASERVLVCVGPSPLSARLVRSARRLATGLKAPLIAVYVEKPKQATLPQADRQRLDQTMRLAEQLGAQTFTLTGEKVAEELIAYASTHNVTKIVVGKPDQPRWREILFGSIVDDLIRHSGEIDIYVIRGREVEETPMPPPAAPAPKRFDRCRHRDWLAALSSSWPGQHKYSDALSPWRAVDRHALQPGRSGVGIAAGGCEVRFLFCPALSHLHRLGSSVHLYIPRNVSDGTRNHRIDHARSIAGRNCSQSGSAHGSGVRAQPRTRLRADHRGGCRCNCALHPRCAWISGSCSAPGRRSKTAG